MLSFDSVLARVENFRDAVRPYARYAAALVAGLAITFTHEITTFTALQWLTIVVAVSLVLWDGPDTIVNSAARWATAVVVFMTVLGLVVGKMSTATALSLTIALVAFETSRAFTRGDRIWLWSTGGLALALSILYFSTDPNDRTAAGLTGGWAIIAGIFGLISAIDSLISSRRGKDSAPRKSVSASSRTAAPKAPTSKRTSTTTAASTSRTTTTAKAKSRGPKR